MKLRRGRDKESIFLGGQNSKRKKKNKGPIWIFNSSNIALPERTIPEVKHLEIENICIITQVRMYGGI